MSGDRARSESVRERTVTLRGVILGLLGMVLIIAMTQVMSIRHSAADVGGDAPPPAPTYLLFFYILIGPLLQRISSWLALTRGELLLIYMMMLVAGPITHQIGIAFLLPHCVAPAKFLSLNPDWQTFWPSLPAWLGPRDPQAVLTFYRGASGEGVPWQAWLAPIVAWSSLLIALFFTTLCINVIFRKQYVENERLTFPLTAIPLAITDNAGPTLREPLFWLGLVVPLLANSLSSLNTYFPSVPALPLREVLLVNAEETFPPPWSGLGEIYFSLTFWLLGIAYLVPQEIALSAWVFYLLTLAQNVLAVAYGHSEGVPSVYTNDFPALYAQGAGAAFALTGITLFAARHHLAAVQRKIFGQDGTIEDSNEFFSYRTAFVGMLFGVVFILSWLCLAGMRLWIALVLLSLILAYFFIFARVRAETGLGMGVILWPKMLDETMLTLVGSRNMTLPDLTILFSLRWLYFTPAIGSVMACQLEGLKLADVSGLRGRTVGWLMGAGAAITVLVAMAATLNTYYQHGFELLRIGRATGMVANQSYYSYANLMEAYTAPKGPEWGGIFAIAIGAMVTVALSWLRLNVLGFPLHPVGYLAANSWGMHLHWMTFFLGWLIKTAVMRYGGLRLFRQLLPLFLGMIVGDMIHQGFWGVVAWATGGVGQ